ncbi:hypothetical protein HY285_02155 [Candidatus Peregrinibacteria bacterium]|nr:hypothetical protein [Candidatus Peregrinibacteria bacterium]MBI3816329.1 hypothetical protein [Candidatus Peregrinibacteria bacterium]
MQDQLDQEISIHYTQERLSSLQERLRPFIQNQRAKVKRVAGKKDAGNDGAPETSTRFRGRARKKREDDDPSVCADPQTFLLHLAQTTMPQRLPSPSRFYRKQIEGKIRAAIEFILQELDGDLHAASAALRKFLLQEVTGRSGGGASRTKEWHEA